MSASELSLGTRLARFCPHQVPSGPISFGSTRRMNRADHVTGGTVLIVKGFMAGTLNRSANILNPLGRVGLLPVMKTSAQRAYLTPDSLSGSPEAWATLPHPAPTSVSRTQAGPAQLIITGPAAVTRQRRDKLLQSHLICAGFCLSSRTQSCTRPKTALLDVSPASVSSLSSPAPSLCPAPAL